ncbi:MAG: hypothetical protein KatS3mg068_1265 [Candidatus Sericytochromatia bacterium]|nr:MAG: hypothetical protein KatS3mg068_1265 [Candidatus Sericytochromatia bacterium]
MIYQMRINPTTLDFSTSWNIPGDGDTGGTGSAPNTVPPNNQVTVTLQYWNGTSWTDIPATTQTLTSSGTVNHTLNFTKFIWIRFNR